MICLTLLAILSEQYVLLQNPLLGNKKNKVSVAAQDLFYLAGAFKLTWPVISLHVNFFFIYFLFFYYFLCNKAFFSLLDGFRKEWDVCEDNKMLKSTKWFDQTLDLEAASICIPRGTGRHAAVAGIITDPHTVSDLRLLQTESDY